MKDVRRAFWRQRATEWRYRLPSASVQFILLLVFWLVLSGRYEATYIFYGVLAAALVTYATNDLFYTLLHLGDDESQASVRAVVLRIRNYLIYIIWLLIQVAKANLHVAQLVLHPRMPINPCFLQFRTRIKHGVAQVIIANSMTLTPGTVTVHLEDGNYIVHVLVPSAAEQILDASLQNKVAAVFLEEGEEPPSPRWVHSLQDLHK